MLFEMLEKSLSFYFRIVFFYHSRAPIPRKDLLQLNTFTCDARRTKTECQQIFLE